MNTKILIILIVLIALGIGGFFIYRNISVPERLEWFQTGNTQEITKFQTKQSQELEDNRIGAMGNFKEAIHSEKDADSFVEAASTLGLKWVRLSIDWFDWHVVEDTKEYSEYYIDPNYDKAITGLANNDIKMMYTLSYWDESIPLRLEEKKEEFSRFKTEEEIQNYLDYVQFIVHHFKDKIEYYEILNEPDGDVGQYVELDDYTNLIKRVVPVIRGEDPNAKIVIGAVCNLREACHHEYLFGILNSDVLPLVNVISFHPMSGASPEYKNLDDYPSIVQDEYYRNYYYNYPSIVQDIKDVALAHGFEGEYIAEEINYRTQADFIPTEPWTYSEVVAAKYYSRGIVMHLGMDMSVGTIELGFVLGGTKRYYVFQNLCTIMAGNSPIDLPVEIQSEATNIKSYSFSLSNGDKLIALWTDGVAMDDDLGINANLTIQDITTRDVTGIDILNGYQQSITVNNESGSLVIQDLIVRDYPLILRIAP